MKEVKITEKLLDIKAVSDRYNVSENCVRNWIKTGKMAAMKIGRRYLVKECSLIKFENQSAAK